MPNVISLMPMANHRSYRRHLGPKFSEGARLLWVRVEKLGSLAKVGAKIKDRTGLGVVGLLPKWLYGDQCPDAVWRARLNTLFRISFTAWDEQPAETFVPPAAREAA
jgi:hypothetical protein